MKRVFVILFFAVSYLSLFAQNEVKVCLRDGSVQTFHRSEIQSISYSNIDIDGIVQDNIVSQDILMAGETVRFPLSEIERVDFVNRLCPDDNHPHAIDLGIGVKWACCNVGASTPEGYGGHYAWGETREKSYYDEGHYQYYISKSDEYVNIGNNIGGTSYDVAHVNWGYSWRMPTLSDIQTLCDNCSYIWIQHNGVNGMMFTGPNGCSIFLPAAGYCREDSLDDVGTNGLYWSDTFGYSVAPFASHILDFSSCCRGGNSWSRFFGLSVRPVSDQ